MNDEPLFAANGLDAESGAYLTPPLPASALAAAALARPTDAALARELAERQQAGKRGYRVNADTRNLAETGWGVVFARDTPPAVRQALAPLLARRRAQAGARYKELTHYPGESKGAFLLDAGVGPGPVVPDKVPYYLMLVGDPAAIPYSFQYELDVQYAVGRIHFDTAQEYASYARSVVAAEQGALRAPRAVFFGVSHPGDPITQAAAANLVAPLAAEARRLAGRDLTLTAGREWAVELIDGGMARRARLAELLGGPDRPALLFSASHGLGLAPGSPRQRDTQGALVCAEWPGPQQPGALTPASYLAAGDLDDAAHPAGMIVFSFACYSAGTPQDDEFTPYGAAARQIAPAPFVARLPQRLLGHPNGGALAFVGHVDRAWGSSFAWEDSAQQIQVFKDALHNLLDGQPIGAALEWFNQRYAELATMLGHELHEVEANGKLPSDAYLARLWTAGADARTYVLIGDPAVRLAVAPVAAPGGDPAAAATQAPATPPANHELQLALEALALARQRHAESAAALRDAEARVAALIRQ